MNCTYYYDGINIVCVCFSTQNMFTLSRGFISRPCCRGSIYTYLCMYLFSFEIPDWVGGGVDAANIVLFKPMPTFCNNFKTGSPSTFAVES